MLKYYCEHCGEELFAQAGFSPRDAEKNPTKFFYSRTGKPRTFIRWKCPKAKWWNVNHDVFFIED